MTTVGGLVGVVGPWSGWLPALYGGCQLVVCRAGLRQLSVEPEEGLPGLVLAHWWAQLGSGAGVEVVEVQG